MTALLARVRTAIKSLGNDGALANVESAIATAAQDRAAVDHLLERLAVIEAARILPAA
jgi:hypothetical protein